MSAECSSKENLAAAETSFRIRLDTVVFSLLAITDNQNNYVRFPPISAAQQIFVMCTFAENGRLSAAKRMKMA